MTPALSLQLIKDWCRVLKYFNLWGILRNITVRWFWFLFRLMNQVKHFKYNFLFFNYFCFNFRKISFITEITGSSPACRHCCGKNTTPPLLTCSTKIMGTLSIKILARHLFDFHFNWLWWYEMLIVSRETCNLSS